MPSPRALACVAAIVAESVDEERRVIAGLQVRSLLLRSDIATDRHGNL